MTGLIVRPETQHDLAAIRSINLAAFDQSSEADLVDRLRLTAEPFLSRVAELDGEVVGHILFTTVSIDGSDQARAAGLAPMAVSPEHQGAGIGSALVEQGLAGCRRAGFESVVVLGHAEYYPRFGFAPASRWGLRYEEPVPDEVFMALELCPGALEGRSGIVSYHPEFGSV